MKQVFIFLIIVFVFSLNANAQEQKKLICGTPDLNKISQRLDEIRKEMKGKIIPRDEVSYVPIRFIIVTDNSGEGGVQVGKVHKALCLINSNYENENTGIQFYIKEIDVLENSVIFDTPGTNAGTNAIHSYCDSRYDALNIFITNFTVAGAAAYYQPPDWPPYYRADWIVCDKDYLNDFNTLTHEIGHYFSLLHPFNGWDNTPWNEADYGNPVTMPNSPESNWDGSPIPVELVNQSNCEIAGDKICDTPADYGFGLISSGCNWNVEVHDANGDLLDPQENNFMNYFYCDNYIFTDGQRTDMSNSLNGQSREYLNLGSYTPNLIAESPVLLSPEQDAQDLYYDYIELDWNDVPGATKYFVQASIFQSFGYTQFETTVETSEAIIDVDLPKNKDIYWRVIARNDDYNVCDEFTSQNGHFKTGENSVGINTIPFISSFSIKPNPVNLYREVIVSINTNKSFLCDIYLTDISGKAIQSTVYQHFTQGKNSIIYPLKDVRAGLYILTIKSKEGILNEKLVVLQ